MHRAAFAHLLKHAEERAAQGDASTLNYLNAALDAVREDVETKANKRASAARKSRAKSNSKTSEDAPADDTTASTAPIETPHASDGETSDQS